MKYSYNLPRQGVVFANRSRVNASYKDLGAVCDAIRYMSAANASALLSEVREGKRAVLYRRNNRKMGARHELGGRKGRFPMKCAKIVGQVLENAIANANGKGLDGENMYVVHVAANKAGILSRFPARGALYPPTGSYGYHTARKSDFEFARIEIGLSSLDNKALNRTTVDNIKYRAKKEPYRPSRETVERMKAEKTERAKRKKAIEEERKRAEAQEASDNAKALEGAAKPAAEAKPEEKAKEAPKEAKKGEESKSTK